MPGIHLQKSPFYVENANVGVMPETQQNEFRKYVSDATAPYATTRAPLNPARHHGTVHALAIPYSLQLTRQSHLQTRLKTGIPNGWP